MIKDREKNLKELCNQKWLQGLFLETLSDIELPIIPKGCEWVEYESYMKALVIQGIPGGVGLLIVEFPADSTEDNRLHTHPVSDRVVTVLKGEGDFIYMRNGKLCKQSLIPGNQVWMPRGTLHTFKSGSEGMTVLSIHSPFISLEDPKCLCYPVTQ